MRIIKTSKLKEFFTKYAEVKEALIIWQGLMESRNYSTLHDLRETVNSVDLVGKYHIFNIKGNDYRLLVAIHYNTSMVFIRDFKSHAEL